jgi:hypothetical protein
MNTVEAAIGMHILSICSVDASVNVNTTSSVISNPATRNGLNINIIDSNVESEPSNVRTG